MRAIILDTNKNGKITYDLESIKEQMKSFSRIPILLERTSLEDIDKINNDDVIGYIENIGVRKGIYRGDVTVTQAEFEELIKVYIDVDQFHLALNVDALKDEVTQDLKITSINNIHYAYMERKIEDK